MSTQAKKDTLLWFKKNEPYIYRVAMRKMEIDQGGELGAIEWGAIGSSIGKAFNSLTTTVSNLAPQYLQFQQQKKVMDMQLKRAQQGLPPANIQDYAPVVKLEPSITPETEAAITRSAVQVTNSAAQKMLPFLIGGGLLGAFLLFRKKSR